MTHIGFFGFICSFQSQEILFYDEKKSDSCKANIFEYKNRRREFFISFFHTSCSKIDVAKVAKRALSGNVCFTKGSMVQKKDIKKLSVKVFL